MVRTLAGHASRGAGKAACPAVNADKLRPEVVPYRIGVLTKRRNSIRQDSS